MAASNQVAIDDTVFDQRIGIVLRIGTTVSAIVILAGGILLLLHHGENVANYHIFHGVGGGLTTLSGIFSGAFHGHPAAIIQLGLVLLIATPVARVVFCIVGFAISRDMLYVLISCIVLCVLLYSLIWH